MLASFVDLKDSYVATANRYAPFLDGRPYTDPLSNMTGTFAFAAVRDDLERVFEDALEELS